MQPFHWAMAKKLGQGLPTSRPFPFVFRLLSWTEVTFPQNHATSSGSPFPPEALFTNNVTCSFTYNLTWLISFELSFKYFFSYSLVTFNTNVNWGEFRMGLYFLNELKNLKTNVLKFHTCTPEAPCDLDHMFNGPHLDLSSIEQCSSTCKSLNNTLCCIWMLT